MPPPTILLDTSALYALIARDDKNHQAVSACLRRLASEGTRLLVIEPVFIESMTLIKRRLGSDVAITAGQKLRTSKVAELTSWGTADRDATWAAFVRYADKDWSYVDCACFAAMQTLGVTTAVSLDHHFQQMGFQRLP